MYLSVLFNLISNIVPQLWVVIMSLAIGETRGTSCGALTTAVDGDNRASLLTKTIDNFKASCRKGDTCSVETKSQYQQISFLEPLVIPFKLHFTSKAHSEATILLEEEGQYSIQMIIGGWSNTRSVLRHFIPNLLLLDTYSKGGKIVDPNEFRPFWIQLQDGVIEFGKGGRMLLL